jgi:FKBP-type peptidyl-prolyl cis-trans isomerase FklB
MNNKITGVFVGFLLFFSSISMAQVLNSKLDSISYILGINLAENIKRQGIKNVNSDVLSKAMAEHMAGMPSKIDKKEGDSYLSNYMSELKNMQGKEAKMEGEAFLAENAKRLEVVVLPSGMQYEILKSGTGAKPKASDKVTTHYHGMLINGTVFDSSVERGEPMSFGVTQVIQGWQEALQMMSVGDKWKLFIPHTLAYGERGAGGAIPPFATLVFEVELLGIN